MISIIIINYFSPEFEIQTKKLFHIRVTLLKETPNNSFNRNRLSVGNGYGVRSNMGK